MGGGSTSSKTREKKEKDIVEVETYTLASDSDATAYRETVVNRLDNILTCAIITACCAILILFHTLKKE